MSNYASSTPILVETHSILIPNTTQNPDFVNHQYDPKAVEALTVQKEFAAKWSSLDPAADVMAMGSIEEALKKTREIAEAAAAASSSSAAEGQEGQKVQALITGSLHLVGGALAILDGADAL